MKLRELINALMEASDADPEANVLIHDVEGSQLDPVIRRATEDDQLYTFVGHFPLARVDVVIEGE